MAFAKAFSLAEERCNLAARAQMSKEKLM